MHRASIRRVAVLVFAALPMHFGLCSRASAHAPVEQGTFVTSDGVHIFYRKVGGGPQPVVYIHGGPGANFRGQNEYLEPLAGGRTMIFYDQRGSGLSDVITDPKRLTVENQIRDLEALRSHFGFRRMDVVALSWGAALATLYASQHPERINRMLLISPMAPTYAFDIERDAALAKVLSPEAAARRTELRRQISTAADGQAQAICREITALSIGTQYVAHPTAAKTEQASKRCNIPAAAIRNRYVVEQSIFDESGALRDWDFRPLMRRLTMPVLVLEGTATHVPLDATRSWAANFPNGRLLLIRDAGHELFLDRPQQFEAAAAIFLSGRFPRGAKREKRIQNP